MHGNVSEWCSVAEGDDRPSAEILGPGADIYQPVRGGQFRAAADRTRAAARHWEHPNEFGPGFRVLQVIASPA